MGKPWANHPPRTHSAGLENLADLRIESTGLCGVVTVAAEAGASDREITLQTGHAPGSRALHRYIRHAAPDTERMLPVE